MPKSRQEFWRTKFAENIKRDRRVQEQLFERGWRVFVAWECEIETDDAVITRIAAFLGPPRIKGCSARGAHSEPRHVNGTSSSKDRGGA